MNEVIKQLYERKSVRVFEDREISIKDKTTILEAACQAPTAGNMLREILPYLGVETGNKDDGTQNNLSDNDLY